MLAGRFDPVAEYATQAALRTVQYLGEASLYAAARTEARHLTTAATNLLGSGHLDALTARHELARWTGAAGDAAWARDQLADLLPTRQRVLGGEHPDTLATRSNLAYWTQKATETRSGKRMST